MRVLMAIAALALVLAGCTGGTGTVSSGQSKRLQASMLEGVNALRMTSGLAPLVVDETLVAAGMRHAQDMSSQKRPWNWGSDGSSPIQRAYEAGYPGVFLAELIAETFENETDTLAAWYTNPEYRAALLDGRALRMGLGVYRDSNGKNWWAMEIGG